MSDSGHRPIIPGPRTLSSEHVLIPKRILVELYELVLAHGEALEKLTQGRIEIRANQRRFEEVLNQYVPGLVLEVMLSKRDEETPVEVPKGRDVIDKSKPPK